MGRRQRLRVRGLEELEEGAREAGFLERVELAVRARVVVALRAQLVVIRLALGRRDDLAVHREDARHVQIVVSGYDSRYSFTKAMKRSASAPSTMRWSNDMEQ